MKKNIKKILKVLGIFLLIILVALIAYLIYLFASYHRIPDNQALKIEKTSDGTAAADTLTTEKEYSALTYNVGFGAYTLDFSFFMAGGNLPGQKVRRVSNLIFRVPENWLLPKIRISH